MRRDSVFSIGSGTVIRNARIFLDQAELTVGEDNLWSDQIIVQTNDQHGIFSLDSDSFIGTGQRATVFEDHVWIGRRSLILPDVRVGRGSVIGAGSVVTRDVEPFSVAAGNPAKAIRKNATWSRSPKALSRKEREWIEANRPARDVDGSARP